MSTPYWQKGMDAAYEQARKSYNEGGLPIGAALIDRQGNIIAQGHNQRVQKDDPTAHGEMDCIRQAGRRRDWHTLTLVTTLSPCAMCTGTAVLHKIPKIIIGENRNFMGREDWLAAEGISFEVVNDKRCVDLMERFVSEKPELWDEDIAIIPEKGKACSHG